MLKTDTQWELEDRVKALEKEVLYLKEKAVILKESEERLRYLFNGARDAIFIANSDAHFVDFNDAATVLTGYSKQELSGMSIEDLHDKKELNTFKTLFNQVMAGEAATFEADSGYDQALADGFIRLNALRLRLRKLRSKKKSK